MTKQRKGDQWGPIVMDIEFYCESCKKRVRGRITVYSDATYVTCQPNRHHHSFDTPNQVPDLKGWIGTRIGDEGDED